MNYYLAGPFWDKDCKDFFDDFSKRCKETKMDNSKSTDGHTEPLVSSYDTVFVPGHFSVDFNKIKSEYDPSSFRRVLRQILDLDLENLNEGLVVYPKGNDLGTMFELGYFLGDYVGINKYQVYSSLRRRLIIHEGDKSLYECISLIIDKSEFISRYYKENCDKILMIDDESFFKLLDNFDPSVSNKTYEFGIAAINVDMYKETPIGSIMAGYLYKLSIPFITYSEEGNSSNVMMLASSLGHVKINDLGLTKAQIYEYLDNLSEDMWSSEYFNKFNNIK